MKPGTRIRHTIDREDGGHDTGTVVSFDPEYRYDDGDTPNTILKLIAAANGWIGTPHVQVEWDDGFDDLVNGRKVWYPVGVEIEEVTE